jgi:hypothetical protein
VCRLVLCRLCIELVVGGVSDACAVSYCAVCVLSLLWEKYRMRVPCALLPSFTETKSVPGISFVIVGDGEQPCRRRLYRFLRNSFSKLPNIGDITFILIP